METNGRQVEGRKGENRDLDRSRYRYIEGDLIEEAGKQKGNRGDERNPIYRTGGINRDIDRSRYRDIERETGGKRGNRDIEISRNRYIEGEKRE